MSEVALLLDTNILWNLNLCRQLTEKIKLGSLRVYIPMLVHAERIRQIADHYGDRFALDVVRQFINDAGFELLPFTSQNAETVADIWLELKAKGVADDYWQAHRFDIALCAVARSTGHTLIVEDRGQHFTLILPRMRTGELIEWLQSLP
jgi:predicted nucleic acid-binding protein